MANGHGQMPLVPVWGRLCLNSTTASILKSTMGQKTPPYMTRRPQDYHFPDTILRSTGINLCWFNLSACDHKVSKGFCEFLDSNRLASIMARSCRRLITRSCTIHFCYTEQSCASARNTKRGLCIKTAHLFPRTKEG